MEFWLKPPQKAGKGNVIDLIQLGPHEQTRKQCDTEFKAKIALVSRIANEGRNKRNTWPNRWKSETDTYEICAENKNPLAEFRIP